MHPTNRRLRAGLMVVVALLAVLAGGGQAQAATAVGSGAGLWYTPAQPADNAVRLTVHIADDTDVNAIPGTAERVTVYLPAEVTLRGDGFPRCSVATIQQFGVEACDAASQLGSGAIRGRLGPLGAPIELRVYVLNGSAPGTVIFYLDQPNGGAEFAFEGQLMPSDDGAYGSRLVVPIPVELQQPAGLYMSITDIDILLHANAGAPYAAIAACPPNPPGFKTVVSFNPTSPGAPAGPLSSTAAATCVPAPPPPVNPIPRPPAPPGPPGPAPPGPESSKPAVAAFGLRLQRKSGQIRALRLTGMSRGARVSVRCLQRCGRRGAELRKSVHHGKVELKRALRPRGRFEVRLSQTGRVTRFARYRVDRRGRTATRTRVGCLDDRGAERACPAAR